jgi:hypothetical protein
VHKARKDVKGRKNGFFDTDPKQAEVKCKCKLSGCSKRYC